MTHGHACPVSDLFGRAGRDRLQRMALPEPWAGDVAAALPLIDSLEAQITSCEHELQRLGPDHPYVPLLMTVPGVGWVLAFTIASEIGDIARFPTAKKLCGYTGLCPRVHQSGERDFRGALSRSGPPYLRWALIEASIHAAHHSAYATHVAATVKRLGRQRGSKVARVDVARKLTEAIWYMLKRHQAFHPAGPRVVLAA